MNSRTVASAVALLTLMCVGGPAQAKTPVGITLGSGTAGEVGSPDLLNLVSADGGATFAPAIVVRTHSAYSLIPGTKWISAEINGQTASSKLLYRTVFVVPSKASAPSLRGLVHADNAATVHLNGKRIGGQKQAPLMSNFQNPAEGFSASSKYFVDGPNVLDFVVLDYGRPTGLDYSVKVTLGNV